ncbi:MAG: hypothetical protein GC145_18870 [Caulobacter sp.]|nr:hypothetical protein [Caulobacter sp.]
MSETDPAAPGRRIPRPSPFVLLLIVLALIILGLLGLMRLRPHPEITEQPDSLTDPSGQSRAGADARAWQSRDDQRASPAAPQAPKP